MLRPLLLVTDVWLYVRQVMSHEQEQEQKSIYVWSAPDTPHANGLTKTVGYPNTAPGLLPEWTWAQQHVIDPCSGN